MQAQLPLSCLLFDLDGTLVDTTALIFESYRYTLKKVLGYTPTDEELLGQYGRPLPDTMRELVTALGRGGGAKIEAAIETDQPTERVSAQTVGVPPPNQALVDHLVHVYRAFNMSQHDAFIKSFPYVEVTLAELRRRGYAMGVVTSKGRATTELSLGRYNLRQFLDTVVTADDTLVHKPDPAPLLLALQRLQKQPGETLYLGDSVHDIAAGRAAGARTAAALWGPFPRADLVALQPDYLLDSMRDLLKICPAIKA